MSYKTIFKEEAYWDVRLLEQEPQLFQIRKNNLRYCPLRKFPDLIVYEIENEDLIIYAVFNSHQNPLRLAKRQEEK